MVQSQDFFLEAAGGEEEEQQWQLQLAVGSRQLPGDRTTGTDWTV